MADLIIYVDHSDVRKGRLAELRAGIGSLVQFIDEREPQLISYGFYFDEPGAHMTVVAVHPDAGSLEIHLRVGGPEFRKLADLIDLTRIDVYGHPTQRVMQQLREKVETLGQHAELHVHELHTGFTR